MQKIALILLSSLFLCIPSRGQQPADSDAERKDNAQKLIDRGILPANYEALLPPDSLGLNMYYSPQRAYRVQISSAEGIVSTLEIPRGTYLNVQADQELNPGPREDITESKAVFRGDIILRTRRQDEVKESEASAAFAVMAKSPAEMVLTGVVVEVEAVEE